MRRFNFILLLLATLLPVAASAQVPHALPPPRWQARLYEQNIDNLPQYVRCVPVGSVLIFAVLGAYNDRTIALDRASGRELWRRSDLTEKVIDGDLTKRRPLPPFSSATMADYRGETIRTKWQLVAAGTVGSAGPIALLSTTQTHIVPDDTQFNKQRTVSETHEEVAIQAITGQELWRRPIDPMFYFLTILDDLIIGYQGNVEQASKLNLRYRDLRTGLPLEPDSQQVQTAIRIETARQGASRTPVQSFGDLYYLDLKTATATHLYHARSYLLSFATFAPQHRIVIHNNPDDDGAGHSVWPLYVDGIDLEGKQIWQFPRVLQYKGTGDPDAIREPYSLGPVAPCRATGTVLCVSDGPIGEVGKHYWYGLDVLSGSVKWRRAMDSNYLRVEELGSGFLFAALSGGATGKSTDRSTLGWMRGRDGKVTWTIQTPFVSAMFVAGDDLALLDAQGNLRAYPLQSLLLREVHR